MNNKGLEESSVQQRIDGQAKSVPPSVGEFAIGERDQLLARVAELEASSCNAIASNSRRPTLSDIMDAYFYATDHPDKYLRGTTNWCAAFLFMLNKKITAAPSPAPMAVPSNEQLMKLAGECAAMPGGSGMLYANYAREVLRRWGSVTAPASDVVPVPRESADSEDWSVFVGYLIDKCEGYTVAEESLQGWLAEMIADPHYGALFRREKTAYGQPVNRHAPIIMAIEAAEEEHGSLRAAAKELGIDAGYLSRLKSGEKINPGDDVLAALGLERVTMYRALLNGGRV